MRSEIIFHKNPEWNTMERIGTKVVFGRERNIDGFRRRVKVKTPLPGRMQVL